MFWNWHVPELAFPLFSKSDSVCDAKAILGSKMPEPFNAAKSARLDIISAASISSHCPLSCFLFQRSLNFADASLVSYKNQHQQDFVTSCVCYRPMGEEPNISCQNGL